MSRKFGKIDARIWQSNRFKALASDGERLAYLWCHTTQFANPRGLYQAPAALAAWEMGCDQAEAESRLEALERVGLIERGPDMVIRIVQWFRVQNAPLTPSKAVATLKAFRDRGGGVAVDTDVFAAAFLEFVDVTLAQAPGWEPDTQVFSHLFKELKGAVTVELNRSLPRMVRAENNLGVSVTAICQALGMPMPSQWNTEKERQRESKTETETETETKTETGNRDGKPETGEGGKPTPGDDLQADIAAMTKRAAAQRKVK